MKIILVILLNFSFSSAWAEESLINKIIKKDGQYFESDAAKPFSGKISGNKYGLYRIETYENGQKHGLWEIYYENGKLFSKTTYNQGKISGLKETFYSDGLPWTKTFYNNSKKTGREEYYYPNGQLMFSNIHTDVGVQKEYYVNGQIRRSVPFVNNWVSGLEQIYYPNGQLKEETTWVKGEAHGPYNSYFESGRIAKKGYYKNGRKNGEWIVYSDDRIGNALVGYRVGKYESGQKVGLWSSNVLRWYDTGPSSFDFNLSLKKKRNKNKSLFFGNSLTLFTSLRPTENGREDGLFEVFYKNGQLAKRGEIKNGKRLGF